MNTDKNEEIYTWLETRSFQQLNTKEQELVLATMLMQDYEEMHQTILTMQGKRGNPNTRGKEAVWQSIEDELKDEKRSRFAWLSYQVPATWVAAVLVFLLALLFIPRFTQDSGSLSIVSEVIHDTVFVEIPVLEKQLIHDTVYQDKYVERPAQTAHHRSISRAIPSLEPELHIQSAKEQEEPINKPKNNSMQYDSMVNKIGFVSL